MVNFENGSFLFRFIPCFPCVRWFLLCKITTEYTESTERHGIRTENSDRTPSHLPSDVKFKVNRYHKFPSFGLSPEIWQNDFA